MGAGVVDTQLLSYPCRYYRVRYETSMNFTPAGMAMIPSGGFTMGDVSDHYPAGDAAPMNIYVSAFYMDTNLITLNLWKAVYSWAVYHGYNFANAGYGKQFDHPVVNVDWYDCVKWCNARSQLAGLTPVYYTDAMFTQVYTYGEGNVYMNTSAKGFRLPTEAEWEKAARGGLSGQRFPWGNNISESKANYFGATFYSYDMGPTGYNVNFGYGSFPWTSPVGSFASNGYGLNDMAGNVAQWCWDWLGTSYGQPGTNNPTGVEFGSNRVLRGGSWGDYSYNLRSACRGYNSPAYNFNTTGFRSVLPLGQ